GDLSRERPGSLVFGLDDPRHAVPELVHAADSKWCLRCGRPYEYKAAYVGHLGDYRCPACGHARPPLDVVARELELRGLEGVDVDAIEVVPELERALDRGLELTDAGGELVILPTYTAMLALREIVTDRGFARPYWERAA